MTIKQISVFLENKGGRLNEVARVLAANDINMLAFCIAETTDFGLMRLIVQEVDRAVEALRNAGFACRWTGRHLPLRRDSYIFPPED